MCLILQCFYSLPFRVPVPHCGSHPDPPEDQTQAGRRGQEAHFSLREEDSVEERQSIVSIYPPDRSDATVRLHHLNVRLLFQLVQGRGAAGVLSPQLHLPEGRPHNHSGQRHQRGHIHLHREEKRQSSHKLLVESTCAVLKAPPPLRRLLWTLNRTHSHTWSQRDLIHKGTYVFFFFFNTVSPVSSTYNCLPSIIMCVKVF